MTSLLALQELVTRHLLAEAAATPAPAPMIHDDGIAPERRWQIHRHHIATTLAQALVDNHSVTARMVGPGFLLFAADQFCRTCPPDDPRLGFYGDGFADFLAAFEPARGLAWLPDLVRLEQAVRAVHNAPLGVTLDPNDLAILAEEVVAQVALVLRPAVRLLASAHPLDGLWQIGQADQSNSDSDAPLDPGCGPVFLVIHRRATGIHLERLAGPDHFHALVALAAGQSLTDALAPLGDEGGLFLGQLLAWGLFACLQL